MINTSRKPHIFYLIKDPHKDHFPHFAMSLFYIPKGNEVLTTTAVSVINTSRASRSRVTRLSARSVLQFSHSWVLLYEIWAYGRVIFFFKFFNWVCSAVSYHQTFSDNLAAIAHLKARDKYATLWAPSTKGKITQQQPKQKIHRKALSCARQYQVHRDTLCIPPSACHASASNAAYWYTHETKR
jgi:hypothetical protein